MVQIVLFSTPYRPAADRLLMLFLAYLRHDTQVIGIYAYP